MELCKACDATAAQLTPVKWALNLLENELLAPHFVWDAQHLYKYSAEGFEHFYNELWTVDCWWDIQSSLPDVDNAVPFSLIINANKIKLSSFGTAKGYPVVVQFPRILKRRVAWATQTSSDKSGMTPLSSYLKTFPNICKLVVLMLSADYKEQCMMLLIQGHMCKCPCLTYPLHLMDQVQDALSTYNYSHMAGKEWLKAIGLWPVEIRNSDPHATLSFDHLHLSHDGVGGRHATQDVKKILNALGCEAEVEVEDYLSHFKNVINTTFPDGKKKCDLVKEIFYACLNVFTKSQTPEGYSLLHILASYLELDNLIGLNVHMESTIEMIKAELLRFNMALKNYSTCLNESMHGPLKEAYKCQSNGKAVASQFLHVDEHILVAKLLRMHIDHHMNWSQLQAQGLDGDFDPEEPDNGPFEGHIYLGSPCEPTTVQNIEADCSRMDRAFVEFCKKLLTFCNKSLVSYGYQVQKWIVIPPSLEIQEYKYLKVNYKSVVDWKLTTDHLQCNPMFYGAPWYDCATVQLTEVPDICSIDLTLTQPFTAKLGATC
ncbi:hypothetical protein EDC04DRAFT_2600286 [Pisolithus marmoratus]|nr:hypothetical protein EDC04DRAFT_2600286 [Pisolithus marmoratus]